MATFYDVSEGSGKAPPIQARIDRNFKEGSQFYLGSFFGGKYSRDPLLPTISAKLERWSCIVCIHPGEL